VKALDRIALDPNLVGGRPFRAGMRSAVHDPGATARRPLASAPNPGARNPPQPISTPASRHTDHTPKVCRWLSNDPIGISGGLNQYVFCANNPVNSRDPLGLCTDGSEPQGWRDRLLEFANIPPEFLTTQPIPGDVWFPWLMTEGPFHIMQAEKTILVGFSYPFAQAGATIGEVSILPFEPFYPELQQYNMWGTVHQGYTDAFRHIWRTEPHEPPR
jgi:hypothetical protein